MPVFHWTSFGMVTNTRSIVLVEFVTSPRHIIKTVSYLNVFIFLAMQFSSLQGGHLFSPLLPSSFATFKAEIKTQQQP